MHILVTFQIRMWLETLCPRQRALCPQPSTSAQPLSSLSSTTMAPHSTRPNSRSNARVTRKRGESDPNEPPKKRKTRQSKGASDDEPNVVVEDNNIERSVEKPARRTRKGR